MDAAILPMVNKPGFYLVASSDGKRYYEVHRNGSCTCADYCYRRAGTYDLCRHGRALRAYLDALTQCPACHGRGVLISRARYADDGQPLPCVVCEQTGRREAADPSLLAVIDQFRAERAAG